MTMLSEETYLQHDNIVLTGYLQKRALPHTLSSMIL